MSFGCEVQNTALLKPILEEFTLHITGIQNSHIWRLDIIHISCMNFTTHSSMLRQLQDGANVPSILWNCATCAHAVEFASQKASVPATSLQIPPWCCQFAKLGQKYKDMLWIVYARDVQSMQAVNAPQIKPFKRMSSGNWLNINITIPLSSEGNIMLT